MEELNKLDKKLRRILEFIDSKQKNTELESLQTEYCNLALSQSNIVEKNCILRLAIICEYRGTNFKKAEQEAIEIFDIYKEAAEYTKEIMRQWGDKK